MKYRAFTAVLFIVCVGNFLTQARAGYFLPDSAMSVTNVSSVYPAGTQFQVSNVIDGNVTEPATGSDSDSGSSEWLANASTANFTLDLGAQHAITEIDLYNTHNGNWNDRGTIAFHIEAGNSVDGSGALIGGTTILTGTLPDTMGEGTILPDKFSIPNLGPFQYLEFFADTAKNNNPGLNEIAVAITPEPAACVLMALGVAGLLLRRHRYCRR